MLPKANVGIALGLVFIGVGCVFLLLVAELVDGRRDELDIAIEARTGLEVELRDVKAKYKRDMDGALERIHHLQNEPNGTDPDEPAGEPPAGELPAD